MTTAAKIISETYEQWAAENEITPDPRFADNDPTAYAETAAVMPVEADKEADLIARTTAALTAAGFGPKAAATRKSMMAKVYALRETFEIQMESLTAAGNQSWRDQLRIPRGNGQQSGRWTFTPWKHLDDLVSIFNALDPSAHPDVRRQITKALDTLKGYDASNIDVHDDDFLQAVKNAADAISVAPETGDESLDAALREAEDGIRGFYDADWTLFDEATDIGAAPVGLGRANKNVWEGNLPGDAAVSPDLDGKTSQELADELLKIKNHPVAPSPSARRKRAEYLKELNDRRDRDELGDTIVAEETDLDQPESDADRVPSNSLLETALDKWVELRGSGRLTPEERQEVQTAVISQGVKAPTLYRGAEYDFDTKDLVVGQPYDFGPSSASEDYDAAAPYAENSDSPVVFVFDGAKGLDVQDRAERISGYAEKEWITAGRFYVTSARENDDGVMEIRLSSTLGSGVTAQRNGNRKPIDMDEVAVPAPAVTPPDPVAFRRLITTYGTPEAARAIVENTRLSMEERRDAGWALRDAGLITQEELDEIYYPSRGDLPAMQGTPLSNVSDEAVKVADSFIAVYEENYGPGTSPNAAGVIPPNVLARRKALETRARLDKFIDELGGPGLPDWYELALRVRAGKNNPLVAAEANHQKIRDKLNGVNLDDDPETARKEIHSIIAELRGQLTDELLTGVRKDGDPILDADFALAGMQKALDKIEFADYSFALDNLGVLISRSNLDDNDPLRLTFAEFLDTKKNFKEKAFSKPKPPANPYLTGWIEDLKAADDQESLVKALNNLRLHSMQDPGYGVSRIGYSLQTLATAAENGNAEDFTNGVTDLLFHIKRVEPGQWRDDFPTNILEDWDRDGRIGQFENPIEADLRARFGTLTDEEMTPQGVVEAVGIFYPVREYNNNCVLASTIYELRRRGIDAQPKQAKKGRNSEATQAQWFNMGSTGYSQTVDGLKGRQAKMRYQITADAITAAHPPGSRGTIRSGWKGRNFGHIWNWEIDADGNLTFWDAQTSEFIGPERIDYWKEMDYRFVRFTRLDNLPLKENIEAAMAPPADSVRAAEMRAFGIELKRAQRVADELRRKRSALFNKWIAMSQTDPNRDATEAAYNALRNESTAAEGIVQQMKSSPEGQKLREVGRSFPFLDPNEYRRNA